MMKTLFSRMLITYLSVTLGLLALLGVTVGSMFQQQYVSEKEGELQREAAEIADTVRNRYMDDDKRPVAERELLTIARQYDALIVLRFADDKYGKRVFIDAEDQAKWNGAPELDIEAAAARLLSGADAGGIYKNMLSGQANIPVISLSTAISDGDTRVAALFLHTDMSRINASIRQVWMDVLLYGCIAVVLAFMAVSYLTGRITKPITNMSSTVMRFSKGEFGLRIPDGGADEVGQLSKSFNIMADELNTLEQARRSFVANVSHELRSPLTSMRGFLEAMQDGTISAEETPKYLEIVINENRRMTGMVNGLLDLARIESGQNVFTPEVFDVNELIARTLLTFEARIDAKKIQIALDLLDPYCYVEADVGQIAQVVRNLIDNALKFTAEEGSLSISTIAADRRTAAVTVTDSGQGIAKEDIPYLFDRFYKAEKAHTPGAQSGTGLGLSIVKRIVDAHGQNITVDSQLGSGTSFRFTLKRADRAPRMMEQGKPGQRRS
ncbi:MAG: HAMP domain-containing histidine kinase [Christensenellaceae bacterium]|jgi:signal transduction histidine kinase|nr:HAMP domain-containing histidine kinase [Christensenellaceae bacterium]